MATVSHRMKLNGKREKSPGEVMGRIIQAGESLLKAKGSVCSQKGSKNYVD